ncbi:MAG: PAS domain-containing sensor histidine kinase [Chloroflexota bacterium]
MALRTETAATLLLIGCTLALAVVVDNVVQPRSQLVSSPYAIPILIGAYRLSRCGAIRATAVVVLAALATALVNRAPVLPVALNVLSLVIVGVIAILLGIERRRSGARTQEVQALNDQLRTANLRLVARNAEANRLEADSKVARREISQILESITDAFCALDDQWRFTYINGEANRLLRRVFGRAPGVLLGKGLWEEFPGARGSQFERDLKRAMTERRPASFEVFYAPATTWLEIHAYPAPVGLALYFRDVTTRMRAEEEREHLLRQVEFERARFQTILGSTVNAILYVERDTGRLLANVAAVHLFGHPLDPGAGESQYLSQLFYPDGRPLALDEAPSLRAAAGRTTAQQELLVIQPGGRRIPVLENAAPVYGLAERVIGTVTVFQDISALKDVERLREEWTSVIAHDLRQPVTLILGYAGLLTRAIQAPESAEERRAVEHILVATRNLAKMIGDLLDLSRIETRHLALQRQAVDLPALIRDVVERVSDLTTGHPVRIEVGGAIPPLRLDPARIEQVLINLLSNAVKYSFPGTEIVVAIARHDDDVVTSVTDHGPGITAEELPRLFARFYRTPEAQVGGTTGLGLGLYIAKGLVTAHGGRIWAESQPGRMTTFSFTLPIQETEG